jgi:hypothetical protein
MQPSIRRLRDAENEIDRTAHEQDLIEVPKRARLDREAETRRLSREFPVGDYQWETQA